MTWSTLSQVFKSENYLALVATVLIASQAPIFETIGSFTPEPPVAKYSNPATLAAFFYLGLFLSGLALFIGRILFDSLCPELIKSYPNAPAYLERLPFQDLTARAALLAAWEQEDQREKYRMVLTSFAVLFIISVTASFLLGATSLALFALN
jgi:hypothetical protein